MTSKSEVLIVEPSAGLRRGMKGRLEDEGYVVTAVESGEEALRLASRKFFPVAVVDLDVDARDGGLGLMRSLHETSRPTGLILVTARDSHDGAVGAFRLGAVDVIRKVRGALDDIVDAVERAEARFEAEEDDALYRETRTVLDESLRLLIEQSKSVYDHLSQAAAPVRPRVLIVDDDSEFLRELTGLVRSLDWEVGAEMSGGGALDKGLSNPYDIIASRDELPDLRGSMVLRSIQTQRSEIVGLLYSSSADARIEHMQQGRTEHTERPFRGPAHLVESIQGLADALGARAQERRIIQAFRADHGDFLRRYAELKLKIDRLVFD